MTAGHLPERDRADIDALVADRYLDALLAAGERRAADAPADASLDPEVRRAAAVLRRSLVRVHPSFRFEERLADRLAGLAAARGLEGGVAADAGSGAVLAFPTEGGLTPRETTPADPLLGAILAGELDPADDAILDLDGRLAAARRPLLLGGAITSAAISLVGVAWVAWRATRPAAHAPGSAEPLPGGLRGLS